MTELELNINSYFGILKEDIQKVSACFKLTQLKKGEFFLKEGRICDKLSFQKSGIVRVFLQTEQKEITQWISTTGYFVTDLAGIIFDKPSKYSIQALTDCEFYTISKVDYKNLDKVVAKWHELEKMFIARCFNILEDRIFSLLSMSAEERYELLHQQNPMLFNQVPLQYLASMMGMTPETLSRIRKKK